MLPAFSDFLELLGVTEGSKGTLSVLNQQGIRAAAEHYFEDQLWVIWPLMPLLLILGFTYLTSLVGSYKLVRTRNWITLALLVLPILFLLILPGSPAIHDFEFQLCPICVCSLVWAQSPSISFTWPSVEKSRQNEGDQSNSLLSRKLDSLSIGHGA